ncbi:6-phosphogluconate dehydrogenase [Nitrobacter sp. Nb-311A]|nr:6-phosphogluconate dehydrogenase [Nitrobacter sp. Nb-311A]
MIVIVTAAMTRRVVTLRSSPEKQRFPGRVKPDLALAVDSSDDPRPPISVKHPKCCVTPCSSSIMILKHQ